MSIPKEDVWIQTHTGKQFFPFAPRVEDICIEDIAHALAHKCRYTGHSPFFYSVAEHSVLVSEHCLDAKWGLMHDAGEAYLPDVARPMKPYLRGFEEIEDRILLKVALAFGLPLIASSFAARTDTQMLRTEWEQFGWFLPTWMERFPALPCQIRGLPPLEAKELFLRRFEQLFPGQPVQREPVGPMSEYPFVGKEPDLSGYSIDELKLLAFRQASFRAKGNLQTVADQIGVSLKTAYNLKERIECQNSARLTSATRTPAKAAARQRKQREPGKSSVTPAGASTPPA